MKRSKAEPHRKLHPPRGPGQPWFSGPQTSATPVPGAGASPRTAPVNAASAGFGDPSAYSSPAWLGHASGFAARSCHCSWTIERTRGGGTRATYEIEIDFGPLVPVALEKALAERGLPNMLANFKARAEMLR